MATSREIKLNWMREFIKKIKPEEELIRQFCLVHNSTIRTAKEILKLVK